MSGPTEALIEENNIAVINADDEVECIDAHGNCWLTLGREYSVESVHGDLLKLRDTDGLWSAARFKLIQRAARPNVMPVAEGLRAD